MHRFSFYCGAAMLAAVGVSGLGCGTAPEKGPAAGGTSAADASDPAAGSDERLTIAVIPKSTGGEFWETVEVGARDAAEQVGVEMKWEGAISETEIAEQKKIIENMVNLGVDGIALAPINPKAMQKDV
jgi:ribose transport system substrate-binding protein